MTDSDDATEWIGVSTLERVFADDCVGQCYRCQRLVYYRPHAGARRITKRLCLDCYRLVESPDDVQAITRESIPEILLWLMTQSATKQ